MIWVNCHKMKIGETLNEPIDSRSMERLTRVPGGWIYVYGDMQGTSSVFVPYNKEEK